MENTLHDITFKLFGESDQDTRLKVLITLVVDLFMEVEALRESLIELTEDRKGSQLDTYDDSEYPDESISSISRGKSIYQKAYLNTAYLTHNSIGPSGGLDKLLAEFYPSSSSQIRQTWRECLFLERLGFSEEEITKYKKLAELAETLT
ncbi:hypothetical protein [Merismopedia glauca]|uniref:Uncharacterized protein n=1 Tax=Merismopedia glauca CCAP 1448/3 TaxID=1296344 RepID=A0A2T1C2E6_9CYAN|nr:hypothetical protein [Merismopedia glauca]PSB02293.1 hypothetical protein C7B64_14015 [Merismopedia glauca CCAP 1448/3]